MASNVSRLLKYVKHAEKLGNTKRAEKLRARMLDAIGKENLPMVSPAVRPISAIRERMRSRLTLGE